MNSENKTTVHEDTDSWWSFWKSVTSVPTDLGNSQNPRPASKNRHAIFRVTVILIAGLTTSSCAFWDFFTEVIPDVYIRVLEVTEVNGTVDAELMIFWRNNPPGAGGRHVVSAALGKYPEIIVIWTTSHTLTDPSGSALLQFQGSSTKWDLFRADMISHRIPVHN